ncbi:MAG: hypothetical protein SNJ82_03160 [Gemmataceae bacterium]
MYIRRDYQHQLDQARKAGLSAREINSAQSGQPAATERYAADANGTVWSVDARGQRICTPPPEAA